METNDGSQMILSWKKNRQSTENQQTTKSNIGKLQKTPTTAAASTALRAVVLDQF